MNICTLFLCCSLAVLCANARPTTVKDEPEFCHGLDCPKYELVGKKDGYEIRKYESSKWAGTTITSSNFDSAVQDAFQELFKYISGENRNNTKIPMASPVATKIVPLGNDQFNFTVLFFTPFAFKVGTPVPTNPKLLLVNIPAVTAYVSSFGGFEKYEQLRKHTNDLEQALDRDGVNYVKPDKFYFTAEYDSPFRLVDRHNEVWLIAD